MCDLRCYHSTDPFALTPVNIPIPNLSFTLTIHLQSEEAFHHANQQIFWEDDAWHDPSSPEGRHHTNKHYGSIEMNITNLLGRMTASRRFLYGTEYGRLKQPKKDACLWREGALRLDLLQLHMFRHFEEFINEGMEVDDAVWKVERDWAQYNWDRDHWDYAWDDNPWRFACELGIGARRRGFL